jgi:regulator of replication initiation timing
MPKGKLSTGKDTKKNLESRISTLEKEVSKWKAIENELQVFLDSFFHITSAFFADIRTCTSHCLRPLF